MRRTPWRTPLGISQENLLQILIRRREEPAADGDRALHDAIERRAADLARNPKDHGAATKLEGGIEDLPSHDPRRLVEVSKLIQSARMSRIGQADQSITMGNNNSGAFVSGDGDTTHVNLP